MDQLLRDVVNLMQCVGLSPTNTDKVCLTASVQVVHLFHIQVKQNLSKEKEDNGC